MGRRSVTPIWPSRDAMLTIVPLPRSTIEGRTARQVWNAPVRSVADDRVPVGRLGLEERPDQGQPGVVDQTVHAPEPADDLLDESCRLRPVGDVRGERLGVGAAGGPDSLEGARGGIRRPVVVDRDECTLGGRLDGDLRADPAAAPGDEDDSTGQGTGHQAAATGRAGAAVGVAQDDLGRQDLADRFAAGEDARWRARTRDGPSRAAAGGPSTGSARSAPAVEMSSKPATETASGTATPSSARRPSAPSASRSLAQHTALNGTSAASSMSMPRAPPSASKLVRTTSRSSITDAGLLEAAPVAGQARPGDVQRARPGEEGDPAVTQRDQRRDHRRDPGRVVDTDVGLAEGMRREVDDGRAIGLHRREVPIHLLGDDRVIETAAGKDDGRGPDRPKEPDVRALALGVALRAAGDDQEAGDRGGVLHAPHDLREIRVGDVVDDDRDHRDPALEESAGERIRDIVERPGRLEDALAGRRADRVVRGRDDARGGRGRDPGELRDLGDGRHQNGKLGGSSRIVTHCHSVNVSRLASPP